MQALGHETGVESAVSRQPSAQVEPARCTLISVSSSNIEYCSLVILYYQGIKRSEMWHAKNLASDESYRC